MKAGWQREKENLYGSETLKEQIDSACRGAAAERQGNYARVAEIRYGKLQELGAETEGCQFET
jgi:ATP-dependent Clp protease ATP-binding subunit ClpB